MGRAGWVCPISLHLDRELSSRFEFEGSRFEAERRASFVTHSPPQGTRDPVSIGQRGPGTAPGADGMRRGPQQLYFISAQPGKSCQRLETRWQTLDGPDFLFWLHQTLFGERKTKYVGRRNENYSGINRQCHCHRESRASILSRQTTSSRFLTDLHCHAQIPDCSLRPEGLSRTAEKNKNGRIRARFCAWQHRPIL